MISKSRSTTGGVTRALRGDNRAGKIGRKTGLRNRDLIPARRLPKLSTEQKDAVSTFALMFRQVDLLLVQLDGLLTRLDLRAVNICTQSTAAPLTKLIFFTRSGILNSREPLRRSADP